jgi:hypothetical protein
MKLCALGVVFERSEILPKIFQTSAALFGSQLGKSRSEYLIKAVHKFFLSLASTRSANGSSAHRRFFPLGRSVTHYIPNRLSREYANLF